MIVVKGKECGKVHILNGNNKPRFRVEKKLKANLFQATLDHVRNEDLLLRVKEQRNILHEIRKRKANWIGHILRRNCILQRVIEGKIQGG
jgi:ribosomal 50S subunit-associated protein YjgA (DUF615 family)